MRFSSIILLISLLFLSLKSIAQIAIKDRLPASFELKLSTENIPNAFSSYLDIESQEMLSGKFGEGYRVADLLESNITLENSGKWITTSEGDFIWRAKIQVDNALAIGLYFDYFELMPGANLHIYDPTKDQILGAYTSENTKSSKRFAIEPIEGNTIIVEYFEPKNIKGFSKFRINQVAAFYRGIENNNYMKSGSCEVDVNCSEGQNWINQRDAVVKLQISTGSGVFYCSGALVNNLNLDCKSYILSAFHCVESGGDAIEQNYLDQLIVVFNYQKSNCGNGVSNTETIVGVDLLAHSDDPNITGSDFSLLELSEIVPSEYDPFLAGWDATGAGSNSGISIHHPDGDVKKISTYSNPLVTGSWNNNGSNDHWRVRWVATDNGHGVTEGGSSGSPIFNADGQIVGQLSGGGSFCTSPNNQDSYGKMSKNWDQNSTPANLMLKTYLDPNNTGIKSLSGTRYWCVNDIDKNENKQNQIMLYPNPAVEILTFKIENENSGTVIVYDALGKLKTKFDINQPTNKIDISNWSKGVYLFQFTNKNTNIQKKFVKH